MTQLLPSSAGLLLRSLPLGTVRVSDEDRIRFLHKSTNDFQQLQPGQGCDSVMVTSTARTIDLVTAYVMEAAYC